MLYVQSQIQSKAPAMVACVICRLINQFAGSDDFVYLRRAPAIEYNPYLLEVRLHMASSLCACHFHARHVQGDTNRAHSPVNVLFTSKQIGHQQVVAFAKADKEELYTLSAKGVNQYRDNVRTEFTPADQWHREVALFTSLKKLRTFQQYKLWKGFRCVNSSFRLLSMLSM